MRAINYQCFVLPSCFVFEGTVTGGPIKSNELKCFLIYAKIHNKNLFSLAPFVYQTGSVWSKDLNRICFGWNKSVEKGLSDLFGFIWNSKLAAAEVQFEFSLFKESGAFSTWSLYHLKLMGLFQRNVMNFNLSGILTEFERKATFSFGRISWPGVLTFNKRRNRLRLWPKNISDRLGSQSISIELIALGKLQL